MDGKMHCFIDMSEHFEISKINLMDKNVVSFVANVFILNFSMSKIFSSKNSTLCMHGKFGNRN